MWFLIVVGLLGLYELAVWLQFRSDDRDRESRLKFRDWGE